MNLGRHEKGQVGPRTRLVLLFGGRSSEQSVSCVTARHVLEAVDRTRHEPVVVAITPTGEWVSSKTADAYLVEGTELGPSLDTNGEALDIVEVLGRTPAERDATVVFPLLHGPHGEDGTVQGLFDVFGVAHVGAGVLASAAIMDKITSKELCRAGGIAQPDYRVVWAHEEVDHARAVQLLAELGSPVFVKPSNMGSSIGVSKAADPAAVCKAVEVARRYDRHVVVETGIEGHEVEVAVLGNDSPEASLPGEIRSGADFYDFADKYADGADQLIPAPFDEATTEHIRSFALECYRTLRCEGMGRVDLFVEYETGRILLNEINTIPGFTPISMYPKMWEASGLDYPRLIDRLIELGIERHERDRHRGEAVDPDHIIG